MISAEGHPQHPRLNELLPPHLAEVAKTRLQLDGELQSRATSGGQPYKRVYSSAFDAIKKTWQTEGIRGRSTLKQRLVRLASTC